MNSGLMHLLWTTLLNLIVSHIGASYLQNNTSRGYWFSFTIISLIVGLSFL